MAIIPLGVRHTLTHGTHEIPLQEHWGTRGHQAHLLVAEHTDPNTVISVEFEVSTDGGKTWSKGGGFTSRGGDHLDKDGQPLRYVTAHFGHEPDMRRPAASRRLVRGTVTVHSDASRPTATRVPINTYLTIVGTQLASTDVNAIPAD